MFVSAAIKKLLKENGKSQAWMAERMGYAHQSGMGQMLNRGTGVTVITLCRICDIMGYEVTIQPRRAGKRPEGQIVIDLDEEGR